MSRPLLPSRQPPGTPAPGPHTFFPFLASQSMAGPRCCLPARPPPPPRSAPLRFPVSETPPGWLGCEFLPLLGGAGTGLAGAGLGWDWDRAGTGTGTGAETGAGSGIGTGAGTGTGIGTGAGLGLRLGWHWGRSRGCSRLGLGLVLRAGTEAGGGTWAGIWAEAGAEVGWDGTGAGAGARAGGARGTRLQSSPCPSLQQGPPQAWGRLRCPVTPRQPRPHWAALGAPGPRCPCPALPISGPGTGKGTSRRPCSCTQHPIPMAAHGAQSPPWVWGSAGDRGLWQGGGQPGSGHGRRLPPRQGCILPAHPFPAGHHARASAGQGHRHRTGSTAAAILLRPQRPRAPRDRAAVSCPTAEPGAGSQRCQQGHVPTGRAY